MAKSPEANLLDFIPVRLVQWESDESGTINLLTPKFRNAWIQKFIQRLGKASWVYVHLDEFGSAAWKQCDGNKSLYEIGCILKNEFGESIEPVFERLTAFVRLLKYHHTLSLLPPDFTD